MLLLKSLAILSLSLVPSASAADASALLCVKGDNPWNKHGSTASVSFLVQWIGVPKGCKKQVIYTASTGITHPLLAFREFDGPNDFHGNLDIISSQPGLKIRQGSKEIALGEADENVNMTNDQRKFVCEAVGYDSNQSGLTATWLKWHNVESLGPCRD